MRQLRRKKEDEDVLAVYLPDKGLYSTSETVFSKLIFEVKSDATEREIKEIMHKLRIMAPHVPRCEDQDLIPVNNGI